jgi:uncharacterized protein YoxC
VLSLLLNTAAVLLVGAVAVHSVVLHIRLTRFRAVLAEVGRVLPTLDASVSQMASVTTGFTQRLQNDLQTVEGRIAAARRLGSELAAASRAAEQATTQLERLLRQHRRASAATAAAVLPRELVEPKGFAARAGLEPPTATPAAEPSPEAASPAEAAEPADAA